MWNVTRYKSDNMCRLKVADRWQHKMKQIGKRELIVVQIQMKTQQRITQTMTTRQWHGWYARQCSDENNDDNDVIHVHDGGGGSSNEDIQMTLIVLTTGAIVIENVTVCHSWCKKIGKMCTNCCKKPVKCGSVKSKPRNNTPMRVSM